MTRLERILCRVRRLFSMLLWVALAASLALAVTAALTGQPWLDAALAAFFCVLAAVLLSKRPRCDHYAQLFKDVEGLGYNCRRHPGHRGLHNDRRGSRWDNTGRFVDYATNRSQP